jgi:sugar/nucleoside kinase (ribokinase family)
LGNEGNGPAGYTRSPFGPIVSGASTVSIGDPAGSPAVLVVGAASRDVTDADPRGWRLGGAVAYASLTLARLGLRVRSLVGADGPASAAQELDLLRDAGAEVAVAPLAHGPVFDNIEQPRGRRQRCLSVADAIPLAALPRHWEGNDAVLLGPVAGELGPEWCAVQAPLVALGWQGLLRRLVAGADVERAPPRPDPLLAAADVVGVSVDDVDPGTRLRGLVDLVRPGATLVVTRGDRGGTALVSRRPARSILRAYPAIPSNGVIDATGAGDVFLAAFVATAIDGARLGAVDVAARLTLAAAAGSIAVEGPGLLGVPTLDAVRRRVAEVA